MASAPVPAEMALLAADSFLTIATRGWFPLWVTSRLCLLGKMWQWSDSVLCSGACITHAKWLTLIMHHQGRKIGGGQNNCCVFRQPVKVVATAGCSSCSTQGTGAEHLVSVDGFLLPRMTVYFGRPRGDSFCTVVSQLASLLPTPV